MEIIAAIISSIATFIAAVVTIYVTYRIKNNKEKKQNRTIPQISIWDYQDDYIQKLEESNIRWVVKSSDINSVFSDKDPRFLCFHIKTLDGIKLNDCSATLISKVTNEINQDIHQIISCQIGRITKERRVALISKVMEDTSKVHHVEFVLEYETDSEENLIYKVSVFYDQTNLTQSRLDTLYKKEKNGVQKKIKDYNRDLAPSKSGKEIKELIK